MQWADIDARHDPDPVRHCAAVAAAGVDIPLDVFEQLFHEPDSDRRLGYLLREIDWSDVVWRESQLSGAALVEVLIPREYEHAVAEARETVLVDGLQDDRPEVVLHWRDHGSWFRSPVLVTGDVIGPAVAYGAPGRVHPSRKPARAHGSGRGSCGQTAPRLDRTQSDRVTERELMQELRLLATTMDVRMRQLETG